MRAAYPCSASSPLAAYRGSSPRLPRKPWRSWYRIQRSRCRDDGPSKKVTIPILNLLKEQEIKATFFVLGSRVELYPETVKRAYEEGHYIANHGYSHKYSQIYESASSVLDEYNKTNQEVKNAIGNQEYNTNIFRFPGGSVGGKYQNIKEEAKQLLEQNNIATVDWNALTGDTEGL